MYIEEGKEAHISRRQKTPSPKTVNPKRLKVLTNEITP